MSKKASGQDKVTAQHTPGPWRQDINDDGELFIDLRPQCKGFADIIVIGDLEETDGEDHANAALIAAAPDLLVACKTIAETWGHLDTCTDDEFERFIRATDDEEERALWRKVRRAIARAEGRQS